jgi:hypothetical protein
LVQNKDAAERFARAGLIGLRAYDATEGHGRRFGGEADARWEGFRGHLHRGDRIELLLADAAVTYGAAFAPSRAFLLPAVADDDPFGPEWPRLDSGTGRRLWTEAEKLDLGDPPALFERAAQALDVRFADGVDVGVLNPATRLLVTGCGALHATVAAFAGEELLDWTEQVVVVADDPCERQLAGLAAVLLGKESRTRLLAPLADDATADQAVTAVRDAGIATIDRALVSTDATIGPRRFVELLRERMGL